MEGLLSSLLQLSEVQEIQNAIQSGTCPALLHGVSSVQRPLIAAALHKATGRPLLVVCSDERELSHCASDFRAILHENPVILHSREWQFRSHAATSHEWEYARIRSLYELCSNPKVVLTTGETLLQTSIPKATLSSATITLKVGEAYGLSALEQQLVAMGYTRAEQVDGQGQFAVRGGILDVYAPGMDYPIRCEFFDTEIDAMGIFDLSTQRRIENIQIATILPACEVLPLFSNTSKEELLKRMQTLLIKQQKKDGSSTLCRTLQEDIELFSQGNVFSSPDRYWDLVYSEGSTPLDYFETSTLVCFFESSRINESIKGYASLYKEDLEVAIENGMLVPSLAKHLLSEDVLKSNLSAFSCVQLDSLPTSRPLLKPSTLLSISTKQLATYGGSLDAAANDIEQYLKSNFRVLVLCGGEVRCQNMESYLRDRGIKAGLDYQVSSLAKQGHVSIGVGALSSGCEFPQLSLAILTEGQLTESVLGKKRTYVSRENNRKKLQSYTDLAPGDLVVHTHHGIGRFVGVVRMPVEGVEKDYVKIAYAGSDCLYVPCTNLDLISKYIGSTGEESDRPARLNKLGGTDWAKATSKAKKAAQDLAAGLIRLYAERQRLGGHAFSPDSPWQIEFENAFEYDLTPDQFRCTMEIKEDMEKPVPMDRLLCGDVGFGKTEVALRACMKCILDGKQCAILVPTTVLAQQHFLTATSRFRSFPITIEVLSRFRTAKECEDILRRAKEGGVDLLIGTHKLLQKDVAFKDLGLLVIDEEQRFGVSHKEKLKEKIKQVDTLTLSATPIPRTLNMALSGIRDMSTIEEPPMNRQTVQTYVVEHDWGLIVEAISRELRRNGQIYYLHNRVEDIATVAVKLRERLGEEVRIATAHGKMSEQELSLTMQKMITGEIDILVCTTIIETGIDIPNVNTLIIEDADHMGLSQLHQIRGRIGRSSRKGYAYLTYRQGKVLSEVATKRLTAIREYVEFGAGFKIAMRDMEIRGAGNLLGPEQSGYMMSVGYDMYLKLLNDAVLEQQGKGSEIRNDCTTDLYVSANIPDYYVPSQEQRMDLYRRIATIRSIEDLNDVVDEIEDRFGEMPKSVASLLEIALLRNDAKMLGVEDITQKSNQVVFTFGKSIDGAAIVNVCAMPSYRSRLRLNANAENPKLVLYLQPKEDTLSIIKKIVDDLRVNSQTINSKED